MHYYPTTGEQKADILRDVVRAIVARLPGWQIEPKPEDKWQAESWVRALGREPEAELSFHALWREERISVSGSFPKSKIDNQHFGPPYGVDRPSATIAMDREAGKAAADLTRRVIKPYLELLRDAKKRRDEYDAGLKAERSITAHLAGVACVDLGNRNDRNSFGTPGNVDQVEVHSYDGKVNVSLKLRNLTPQLAEMVIVQVQNCEQAAKTPLFDSAALDLRQC
jgi:hypothetical protein